MKRKILYIHHASKMGGAPISLSSLISKLDKEKYHPIVVMPQRKGNEEVKELFSNAGAEVIEERHIRPFNGVNGCRCDSLWDRSYAVLSSLPTAWAARKYVRKLKPDLVHLNTSVLPFAALGVKLSGTGVPVIVHVRETALKNWWGKLLGFFNRRFADWYVGIDKYGLDRIKAPENRRTVINNSIDTSDIETSQETISQLRQRFNCQDEDILFVSISRIAPSNGTLELAELLADKVNDLPKNARFVFCGFKDDCEYSQKCRVAIEQSDFVFAMDFTSKPTELICASDVVVAPFVSSHSARVVIEGASLGKPALVSDLPNLREQILVDKTGVKFRFEEPDTLVKAVWELSDRNRALEMGRSAAQFAEDNFSLQQNVARMESFYERILEGKFGT